MPEGDTVHKIARRIGPLLIDQTIIEASSRWPRVVAGVPGTTVRAVHAEGKHLLVSLSDSTTLRVHLGMTGSWRRSDPGAPLGRSPGMLGLLLATKDDVLACFHPAEVERIDDRALRSHPALSRLGPDLLREDVDLDCVVRRARAPERQDDELADLLLDQSVASGIGNVYKSELCFMRRLDPFAKVRDVKDDELRALYEKALRVMRANVDGAMRTTTAMPRRYWVYGAGRAPCLRCRGPVRMARQGPHRRTTWWCPRCQPTRSST